MNRIKNLLESLNEGFVYLIQNPIDIYYLTGLHLSTGTLMISPIKCALMVDGRYFEACKAICPVPIYLTKEGLLFDLVKGFTCLIVDGESMQVTAFFQLEEEAKKRGIAVVSQKSFVKPLRAIKDSDEIALLSESSQLGLEGFKYVKSLLKPGITEQEVAFELEYFWRKKGAEGVAFEPIIAFGENSAMPHHRAALTVLKENDIALIDIGVKWNHYHSDMTRVLFFGKVEKKLMEIHKVVKQAIEAALKEIKPGISIRHLDESARDLIKKNGYGDYFTHSLGHGVGLEIHEYPLIKSAKPMGDVLLEEGMVITIEPGIYLPGLGGVRLEDTVVVTEDGYENLTKLPYA